MGHKMGQCEIEVGQIYSILRKSAEMTQWKATIEIETSIIQ